MQISFFVSVHPIISSYYFTSVNLLIAFVYKKSTNQGPELKCLLKVRKLSIDFQDAKNNILN